MSVRRELLGLAAYLVAVVVIVGSMYAALGIALTPPDPGPMAASSAEPDPEPAKLATPKVDETFTLSSAPPIAAAPPAAAEPPIKSPPYAKIAKEKAQAEMGAQKKKRAGRRAAPQETTETLGYAPTPRYGPFSTNTAY